MHERTSENLAPAFPEWELFARTRRGFDPQGIFFNEHLVSVLGDG
jgi:FAD/FMN-containing dehydrogenase